MKKSPQALFLGVAGGLGLVAGGLVGGYFLMGLSSGSTAAAATTSGNDVWVTGEYGEFQVLGTHPYTKPGAFQIRVRVDDHFGEEYYTGFPYYYGVSVR